uniref:Late embryogenesis abundant protein LEA-2 subgroup domain-containing protein n=1 Tax=Cajanus cajan TaxID=3821 RepID=A0A151TKM5_CAJCA|nr:hypothetical protein KK1_023955 [Cajanus cajan]
MSRRETNPHFTRSSRPEYVDHDTEQQHIPFVPPRHKHRGQPSTHGAAPIPDVSPRHKHRGQPSTHGAAPIPDVSPRHKHRGQPSTHGAAPTPDVPPRHKRRGQPSTHGAAPIPDVSPRHHEDRVPLRVRHEDHVPLQHAPEHHSHTPPILQEPHRGKSQQRSPRKQPTSQGFRPPKSAKVNFQEPPPLAAGTPAQPLPDYPLEPRHRPRHDHPPHHGIKLPEDKKSHTLTWLAACLCVIFCLVIIIGGLIVLIVYFIFRPQSPHFDVSSVTLNAAYLDLGYLLNADLTMLANFTNPNKKVHVDFSSVIIYLYYGIFRARSKLGSILRYSYNLYGRCSVMLTRPPDGILLKKKCRTKR